MAAQLAQLVEVRSQLAETLLAYLTAVETALAKNALLDRFGRWLDDVRIPLKVVPYQAERHRAEAAETERLRPPTPTRDEDEPAKQRYAGMREEKEPVHPPQPLDVVAPLLQHAVLLADPGGGKTEWLKDLARRQASQSRKDLEDRKITPTEVVIPVFLRLPELAKTLAEETPKELHEFLVQRECLASSSVLNEAQRVAAAILRTLLRQNVLPENLVRFVWDKWFPADRPHPSSFIPHLSLLCLDAWDEVRKGRETLAPGLNAFAAASSCRIFLTSRIVGYSQPPPLPVKSVADGAQRELRICPFEWNDTEKFVQDWFGQAEQERGAKMIGELRTKYSVWGMASNPLMATLLCLAYSPYSKREPLPFPLRRGAVYERVLWGLLGEWSQQREAHEPELRELSDAEKKRCADKLDLLAELAHHFFLQDAQRFSRTALEAAMRSYLSSERGELFFAEEAMRWSGSLTEAQDAQFKLLKESAQRKLTEKQVIAALCQELIERDGLLALDMEDKKESWYGFLHLTFQEYLTACELGRQANDEGWQAIAELVDRKAWLSRWEETLILLAGRMKYPIPFLELLRDAKRDDFFRHRLCLAARCLLELSTQGQSEWARLEKVVGTSDEKLQQITQQISEEVFNLWWEYRESDCGFQHINRSLPTIIQSSPAILLPVILERLQDPIALARRSAVMALKQMGAAAAKPEILTALASMLQDSDDSVCVEVPRTLERMGLAAAIPEVLSALVEVTLHYYRNDSVRRGAANVLRRMEQSPAFPEILTGLGAALRDSDPMVCGFAADALGELGPAAAQPEVLTGLVARLNSSSEWVRRKVVGALREMGSAATQPGVLTSLINAVTDPDDEVCRIAAAALDQIGVATCPEILTRLGTALHDPEVQVRCKAAKALGRIGSAAAQPEILLSLVKAMHDADDEVYRTAATALEQMGAAAAPPEVLTFLSVAMCDSNARVRYKAADALQKIRLAIAIPEVFALLVKALDDPALGVRHKAAEALGQMGPAAAKPDVLNRLGAGLHDPEARVRRKAAEALGRIGSAAAQPEILTSLVKAVNDSDDEVCREAIKALEQMGAAAAQTEVMTGLVKSLLDRNPWILGNGGGNLLKMVQAPEATASLEAWTGLVRVLTGLSPFIWHEGQRIVLKQLNQATVFPEVLTSLVKTLNDPDGEVRRTTAKTLIEMRQMQPEAITMLINDLHSPDSHARVMAGFDLIEFLRKPAIRQMILETVHPEGLIGLINALHDSNFSVHAFAEYFFREVNDVRLMEQVVANLEVLTELVNALHARENRVCHSAAVALGKIMAQEVRFFKRGEREWEVKTLAELVGLKQASEKIAG